MENDEGTTVDRSTANVECKWRSQDELIFLDSLQTLGCDNWVDVADVMKLECRRDTFQPEELSDHFEQIYLDGDIGKIVWNSAEIRNTHSELIDHTLDKDEFIPSKDNAFEKTEESTMNLEETSNKEIPYQINGKSENTIEEDLNIGCLIAVMSDEEFHKHSNLKARDQYESREEEIALEITDKNCYKDTNNLNENISDIEDSEHEQLCEEISQPKINDEEKHIKNNSSPEICVHKDNTPDHECFPEVDFRNKCSVTIRSDHDYAKKSSTEIRHVVNASEQIKPSLENSGLDSINQEAMVEMGDKKDPDQKIIFEHSIEENHDKQCTNSGDGFVAEISDEDESFIGKSSLKQIYRERSNDSGTSYDGDLSEDNSGDTDSSEDSCDDEPDGNRSKIAKIKLVTNEGNSSDDEPDGNRPKKAKIKLVTNKDSSSDDEPDGNRPKIAKIKLVTNEDSSSDERNYHKVVKVKPPINQRQLYSIIDNLINSNVTEIKMDVVINVDSNVTQVLNDKNEENIPIENACLTQGIESGKGGRKIDVNGHMGSNENGEIDEVYTRKMGESSQDDSVKTRKRKIDDVEKVEDGRESKLLKWNSKNAAGRIQCMKIGQQREEGHVANNLESQSDEERKEDDTSKVDVENEEFGTTYDEDSDFLEEGKESSEKLSEDGHEGSNGNRSTDIISEDELQEKSNESGVEEVSDREELHNKRILFPSSKKTLFRKFNKKPSTGKLFFKNSFLNKYNRGFFKNYSRRALFKKHNKKTTFKKHIKRTHLAKALRSGPINKKNEESFCALSSDEISNQESEAVVRMSKKIHPGEPGEDHVSNNSRAQIGQERGIVKSDVEEEVYEASLHDDFLEQESGESSEKSIEEVYWDEKGEESGDELSVEGIDGVGSVDGGSEVGASEDESREQLKSESEELSNMSVDENVSVNELHDKKKLKPSFKKSLFRKHDRHFFRNAFFSKFDKRTFFRKRSKRRDRKILHVESTTKCGGFVYGQSSDEAASMNSNSEDSANEIIAPDYLAGKEGEEIDRDASDKYDSHKVAKHAFNQRPISEDSSDSVTSFESSSEVPQNVLGNDKFVKSDEETADAEMKYVREQNQGSSVHERNAMKVCDQSLPGRSITDDETAREDASETDNEELEGAEGENESEGSNSENTTNEATEDEGNEESDKENSVDGESNKENSVDDESDKENVAAKSDVTSVQESEKEYVTDEESEYIVDKESDEKQDNKADNRYLQYKKLESKCFDNEESDENSDEEIVDAEDIDIEAIVDVEANRQDLDTCSSMDENSDEEADNSFLSGSEVEALSSEKTDSEATDDELNGMELHDLPNAVEITNRESDEVREVSNAAEKMTSQELNDETVFNGESNEKITVSKNGANAISNFDDESYSDQTLTTRCETHQTDINEDPILELVNAGQETCVNSGDVQTCFSSVNGETVTELENQYTLTRNSYPNDSETSSQDSTEEEKCEEDDASSMRELLEDWELMSDSSDNEGSNGIIVGSGLDKEDEDDECCPELLHTEQVENLSRENAHFRCGSINPLTGGKAFCAEHDLLLSCYLGYGMFLCSEDMSKLEGLPIDEQHLFPFNLEVEHRQRIIGLLYDIFSKRFFPRAH